MKTTIDFSTKLFELINASAIRTEITGGIYPDDTRPIAPAADLKEDVVINILPVPKDQLQEAIGNINIYVPNLANVVTNGQPDLTHPNNVRLNVLSKMVIDLVTDYYGEDFHCDFDQQQTFPEQSTNEHYSNIRVKLFSINI